MTIQAFIVDDEPLARERIRKLLQAEPDVRVAGEFADGREAVAAVHERRPDLIFLDVQMPELDGFGVIEALRGQWPPAVIFVTAYDQFALKAFEVHAVDYLLKPFDRDRFQQALGRARARLENRQTGELNERLAALLENLNPRRNKPDLLVIKCDGRVLFLKTDDIDWIEAADNYVNLHAGNTSHLFRETMNAMETKLPPQKFLRISRSAIVNVDRIKELQPMFHGEYTVFLRNGTRLTLSRSYRDKLEHLMGK